MSIIEVAYYEVACDEPGCSERTSTGDSDYSAWSDHGQAEAQWENEGGQIIDGKHYCPDHLKDEDEDSGSVPVGGGSR